MFPSHELLRLHVEISLMFALGFALGRVNAESNSNDFSNEPAAHVQFDKMLAVMRVAESLSYESDYVWTIDVKLIGDFRFRVWLKKPNHFRVEVEAAKSGEKQGILIGDGEHAWLHWPNGRPQWGYIPEDPDTYQKTQFTQYRKQETHAGKFSIAHAMVYTAKMMGMPTLNPSSFFGFGSSLYQHIDGVRSLGEEEINGKILDVIEIHFMDSQRTRKIWLSREDHLPRKIRETVNVSVTHVMEETWSNLNVGADISDVLFTWSPPEGWTEWKRPQPDDLLLNPGTEAPDFELRSSTGEPIALSDFRGNVVWFYVWRVGCPPCRPGIRAVQHMYAKHADSGLAVLGFNQSDDKEIALSFMEEAGITFPVILDSSEAAEQVAWEKYRTSGVPVNYIIDRDGVVVDAWYGYEKGHKRAKKAIEKAGLEL